jgi:hypothetical protein
MTRRLVVAASWYTARSIVQNWRPAARWWLLTLECGHEESRRMRYRGIPSAANGTQYAIEQAAPAPAVVDCRKCTQQSGQWIPATGVMQ